MAVKKVVKKKKKATVRTSRKKPAAMELELPTEMKSTVDNFFAYSHLIYGRPGWGKTTLMASFPDTLLFSCERVSKGIECFDFNAEDGGVSDWDIFRQGVALLKKTDRFQTVAIDTVDAAYTLCLNWVCKRKGLTHPSDADDFGGTWNAVKEEFSAAMDGITSTGRGIVFSSHAKEVIITSHSGDKYTRIQPTMSGQAYAYIKAKTDFVLYADFIKDIAGKSRRVLITQGDEVVDAKSAGDMPLFLDVQQEGGADTLQEAFTGENPGIPIEEIRPDKATSAGVTDMIKKKKVAKAQSGLKKRKVRRK